MFSRLARTRRPCCSTATSVLHTHARRFTSTKGSFLPSTINNKTNNDKYKKYEKRAMIFCSIAGSFFFCWAFPPPPEVPRLETSRAELTVERGPSEAEVTRIISQEAYSILVRNVTGADRYDGAQLASNSPCEDRFTHGKFPSPRKDGRPWMAWAVFDGHSGWQTADLLKKHLLSFVRNSLTRVESASRDGSVPEEVAQRAIIKGFVNLDDSIIKTALTTSWSKEPLQDKVKKLAPAYAGSCALLSLYDPDKSELHVACTGDSRAVLGQRSPDGKWEAIPLSVDQTGHDKEEVARLNKEHPGEESITKDGRVPGIMVSRGFGDGRWKWPLVFQQDLKQKFNGLSPLTPTYDVRMPPYLTAAPVVTTTKIDSSKPSFLILATDGLWDMLSNQQAVDLVGKRIKAGTVERSTRKPDMANRPFDFGQFEEGVNRKFVEERTTVQDDNAAVHLIRNSLGGSFHELIAGRLALSSPFSRRLRDDITVQVIFFNLPKTTPKITLNYPIRWEVMKKKEDLQ